jgi:FkbM family methyltransferase
MSIAILFARGFAYLSRFSVACENFGFFSAFKVFIYTRSKPVPAGVSLAVKRLRREIVFRGSTDGGVLYHFYSTGFRIRDTAAHPVKTIVDAGANIGDETLRFRHFHPQATIVAIEPDAGNYEFLVKNVGADPLIHALHSGLWSRECRLRVIPGASAQASRVEEVEDLKAAGDIEAVSIPFIMDRFTLSEIDILKMDIEGAEYEVFSSPDVAGWIGRVKVLIFECPDADRPGATQKIFEKIAGLEFKSHVVGECIVLIRRDTDWTLEANTYL